MEQDPEQLHLDFKVLALGYSRLGHAPSSLCVQKLDAEWLSRRHIGLDSGAAGDSWTERIGRPATPPTNDRESAHHPVQGLLEMTCWGVARTFPAVQRPCRRE